MPTLGVLLTDDRGLAEWDRVGSLERELALYRELHAAGWQVTLFSYDRRPWRRDLPFAGQVRAQWPFVLPRRAGALYRALLPWRFWRTGLGIDVLLTNQSHAASPARQAARLWGVPLVARSGYVFGECVEVLGDRGPRTGVRLELERATIEQAARCVVPTTRLADWVSQRYQVPAAKLRVIPNYVDTAIFHPAPAVLPDVDVTVVGRLEPVKGHAMLLDALAGSGRRLHFIGDGTLRGWLQRRAHALAIDLRITRRVLHRQLAAQLRASRVVVNASSWEGHPKALLEAMATGCACVAVRSPGLSDVIEHGRSGLLVEREPAALRVAIQQLLDHPAEARALGQAASAAVTAQCALDRVATSYRALLDELL